jgi:hypothetical protein
MRAQLLRRLKLLEQQARTSDTEPMEPMKALPPLLLEAWYQQGGRFDEFGRADWSAVGRMRDPQGLTDDRPSADVANGGDTQSEPSSTPALRFD